VRQVLSLSQRQLEKAFDSLGPSSKTSRKI